MQRYGQKTSKMPPKCFSPICDPQYFFQKSGSVTLYPYGAVSSCKKLEKTDELALRYLKADYRLTNGPRTRAITKDPLGEHSVQKWSLEIYFTDLHHTPTKSHNMPGNWIV